MVTGQYHFFFRQIKSNKNYRYGRILCKTADCCNGAVYRNCNYRVSGPEECPYQSVPDITPPTIKINTSFVGANAVNVEQGVAAVIEQKVNGVEDMIYMRSTNASDGNLSLDVSFKVGTNLDNANMLTQNRVSQAQPFMPPSVKQFGITTKKSLTFPLMVISLTSENPAFDARFLANYASINLVDALSRISGVGEVKMLGSSDYAMRIWLKPDIMSKLDITVEDVTRALQEQNVISPGGKFGAEPAPSGTEFTYGVVLQDRLIQEGQFADVIIKTREDGSTVRLSDISSINLGTENYNSFANEQEAGSNNSHISDSGHQCSRSS